MRTVVRAITTADLQRRIEVFEAAYGYPTDRLVEAFTVAGVLVETDDFHEWAMLADLLEILHPA